MKAEGSLNEPVVPTAGFRCGKLTLIAYFMLHYLHYTLYQCSTLLSIMMAEIVLKQVCEESRTRRGT